MRSSTEALDRSLRQVLAAYVVDDPDAPANYSVQLSPPVGRAAVSAPLHRLFEAHCEVVRDRAPLRVVRALLAHLGALLPPDADLMQVRAVAVVGPNGAVLAPASWRRRAPGLERHLRRARLRILDAPFACLDVRTGNLVVPTAALAVDEAALASLDGLAASPPQAREAALPPGSHPLTGWAMTPSEEEQAPSGAAALVAAVGLVANLDAVGWPRALEALARQLRSVALVPAPPLDDRDAAALLVRLASGLPT